MVRAKIVAFVVLSLLVSVGGMSGALAQDGGVRTVDVRGYLPAYKISPDGHTVAVFEVAQYHEAPAPDTVPIHMVDIATGQELFFLAGFTDFASDVAFSPDGARLASCHQNGYILLWDMATGKQIGSIPAVPGNCRIAFTPDGASLITVVNTGLLPMILEWNLADGSIRHVAMLRLAAFAAQTNLLTDIKKAGHYGISAFAVAADGATLAGASLNQDILLWDLSGSTQPTAIRQGAEGAEMRFGIVQIAYVAGGTALAYLDYSGDTSVIYRLDLATGTESVVTDIGDARVVGFSPDGTSFAWLQADGGTLYVATFDQPTRATAITLAGMENLRLNGLRNLRSPQAGLTFTPDGQQVILGGFLADDGENALIVVDLS